MKSSKQNTWETQCKSLTTLAPFIFFFSQYTNPRCFKSVSAVSAIQKVQKEKFINTKFIKSSGIQRGWAFVVRSPAWTRNQHRFFCLSHRRVCCFFQNPARSTGIGSFRSRGHEQGGAGSRFVPVFEEKGLRMRLASSYRQLDEPQMQLGFLELVECA